MASIDGVQPVVCAQRACDGWVSPHPSHSESREYDLQIGARWEPPRSNTDTGEWIKGRKLTSDIEREGAALPAAADAQTERETAKSRGGTSDLGHAQIRDIAESSQDI